MNEKPEVHKCTRKIDASDNDLLVVLGRNLNGCDCCIITDIDSNTRLEAIPHLNDEFVECDGLILNISVYIDKVFTSDKQHNRNIVDDKLKQEILDNPSLYEYHCECMGKDELDKYLGLVDESVAKEQDYDLSEFERKFNLSPTPDTILDAGFDIELVPQPLGIPDSFIEYIKDTCVVDEITGELICKNCYSRVVIDWFEKTLECQGCDDI